MSRMLLAAFIAIASPVFAQHVEVAVRADKPVYLQGEPVYVVVEIKNISEYPIGYGDGGTLRFEVAGRAAYDWRQPCRESYAEGIGASSVDHPPTFLPGQIRIFRYLLRGYRLERGRHVVRISGHTPVRWFQGYSDIGPASSQFGSRRIPYAPRDPVGGAAIDREVAVEVVPASPEELRRAFGAVSPNNFVSIDREVAEGIIESAQSFHTDLIARFASHPNFKSGAAYEALADINTADSRAHLRRLFDEEPDLQFRVAIVIALSRLSHSDSLEFLASLLPGRTTPHDETIKSYALRGLQCIGGDKAVAAIVSGTRDWADRAASLEILKKYAPREAIDVIVQRHAGADLGALLVSCAELMQLTHYQWCDDDLAVSAFSRPLNELQLRTLIAKIQSQWQPWWTVNRDRIPIYRPEDPMPVSLPTIWVK